MSVTQSLISIVLAIYKPNEVFLRKQLKSLNEQIYPNIELIICDDSENQGNDFLCSMIRKTITNFEWRLYKNKKNIGSNKTFELLTKMAKGEYIAYCDQDDIWEKNKLTALYDNIIKHESVLSYSDLCVIDENDTITYKSLRKLVPRLKHVQGDLLYQYFIKRNSITGCTLLVKSSIAKEAVPFLNGFVHDHWIALYASIMGSISYVPEALIRYRIHGNNQIGTKRLDEICSKVDYLKKRLYRRRDSMIEILNRLNNYPKVLEVVNEELRNIQNRIAFFEKRSFYNLVRFVRACYKEPHTLIAELMLCFAVSDFDKIILKIIKRY